MTAEKIILLQSDALRRRAEDVFREKAAGMEENMEALSPEEVRQLVHEPVVSGETGLLDSKKVEPGVNWFRPIPGLCHVIWVSAT